MARQGLPFCGKALNVQSSGNTISSLKFDGVDQCSTAGTTLQQTRADASLSDSASIGTYLISNTILCKPANLVVMGLYKSTKPVKSPVTGFADPYEYRPGIKYIVFHDTSNKGACVYQQRGSSRRRIVGDGDGGGSGVQSPEGESNTSDVRGGEPGVGEQSSDLSPGGKGTGGGGDSSIWVWLGPIVGAVATVAAALITVYCVRKGKQASESGDGAAAGGATGISGGVHINVGQQGGHSQHPPQPDSSSTASNQHHWHNTHLNLHGEHYQRPPYNQPYQL